MKLLVKVVETRFADTPQVAVIQMSDELFSAVQNVMSHGVVSIEIKSALGEYYFVDRRDLSRLIDAAEGRVTDWDGFTHLVLEDESSSQNWTKIEVHDPYMVFEESSICFKATDAEGFEYLTAPLTSSDLASTRPKETQVLVAAMA